MLTYRFNVRKVSGARHEARMSQSDMSKKLNMSRQTYGLKENGRSPFGIDDLANVANITHKSVEYFFDITVTKSKQNL